MNSWYKIRHQTQDKYKKIIVELLKNIWLRHLLSKIHANFNRLQIQPKIKWNGSDIWDFFQQNTIKRFFFIFRYFFLWPQPKIDKIFTNLEITHKRELWIMVFWFSRIFYLQISAIFTANWFLVSVCLVEMCVIVFEEEDGLMDLKFAA